MNPNILSGYLAFLKQQIIKQEAVLICHHKAQAQLQGLLLGNLSKFSPLMLHHYLWVLDDILHEASRLSESLLNEQLNFAALLERPPGKPV